MLLKVYAGQQDDGSWPQWFHFLPELISPGHRNSHGDIAYWPLLVLGEYLERTSDLDFLDEQVPFVKQRALSPRTAIRDHVLAALDYIEAHRTRDPRLPAYGHGDWNDSLQPTSASLAEQMCSTWTTELEIHSLETLANALGPVYPDLSKRLRSRAAATREGLTDVFLADGELAGYAIIGNPTMELMVHPRDERTGLHHGILQMIHAISGELLDPLDMKHHLDIIAEYLTGPMGTYLFDAPITYSGGTSHYFKRAEAATFWGREIGLMYTHAHLRFIEALTHAGRAQQAWDELKKVIPIGITNRVPGAMPRQVDCYYSSADTVFADRYEASQRAHALFTTTTAFEGGWRVYSSGPGLILRIVTEDILGIRIRGHQLIVDPVLPVVFDGTTAVVHAGGRILHINYHVNADGHGVTRILVEGLPVEAKTLSPRYRRGGQTINLADLSNKDVTMDVWMG